MHTRQNTAVSLVLLLAAALSSLFLSVSGALAAQARVAWNQSTDPGVIGYKVYQGFETRNYTTVDDVHGNLTHVISWVAGARPRYVAVTAYSSTSESDFSEELICYTVTASASSNGTISPSGDSVSTQGGAQAFTITPAANYRIADVRVDGISVGAVSGYKLSNICANHTISATFAASVSTVYTITASAGTGGTISPSGSTTVKKGSSQAFTITPAANYRIADVRVDGISKGAVSTYTFSGVAANHTISATFTPITFTVAASGGIGGTISPSGSTTVKIGANQGYAITPAANYKVADVKVDGVSKGAIATYTFSNITANHTISATFAPVTFTIKASAGTGGTISPPGTATVNKAANLAYSITPAGNYRIADVRVDGASVGAVSSYNFRNVSANHAILASFAPASRFPIADAGPDQTVKSGGGVTLNGSNSSAKVGIASYQWTQVDGPTVELSKPMSASCTFRAPSASSGVSMSFRLKVVDAAGVSAGDICIVDVSGSDLSPTAAAGPDQVVSPYTITILDGRGSYDLDDGIAKYRWTQISGPKVQLNHADTAVASFVAPDAGQDGSTLGFQLIVSDHSGLRMTDQCLVNVLGANQPPTAKAGSDKIVYDSTSIILDGSSSSSPTGGAISYRWKQLSGPPVSFSDPAAQKPSFTPPDVVTGRQSLGFMLTVTDDSGISASDKCTVTVRSRSGKDLTGNWDLLSYNGTVLAGSLTILNAGSQAITEQFQVAFYLSDDGRIANSMIGSMSAGSIPAGGSVRLRPNLWLMGGYGKSIIAVIDSGGKVAETNEMNNNAVCLIR